MNIRRKMHCRGYRMCVVALQCTDTQITMTRFDPNTLKEMLFKATVRFSPVFSRFVPEYAPQLYHLFASPLLVLHRTEQNLSYVHVTSGVSRCPACERFCHVKSSLKALLTVITVRCNHLSLLETNMMEHTHTHTHLCVSCCQLA